VGGGGEGPDGGERDWRTELDGPDRDSWGGAWDRRAELDGPDDGGGALTTLWLAAPLLALAALVVGYLAGWELP
jgi:hypothetical protein